MLSPELLRFRDFERAPTGVWLWKPGAHDAVRLSAAVYENMAARPVELTELRRGHSDDLLERLLATGILLPSESLLAWSSQMERAAALDATDHAGAAAAVRNARIILPTLETTWFREFFILLRSARYSEVIDVIGEYYQLHHDPVAHDLAAAARSRVPCDGWSWGLVLAKEADWGAEVAAVASDIAIDLRSRLGIRLAPAVVIDTNPGDSVTASCRASSFPFVGYARIGAQVLSPEVVTHELTHALLFSANLAFSEGLAVYMSGVLADSPSAVGGLRGSVIPVDRLLRDTAYQRETFREAERDWRRPPHDIPEAYRVAGRWLGRLTDEFGLERVSDFLQWLRHPALEVAVRDQDRLFELHFQRPIHASFEER